MFEFRNHNTMRISLAEAVTRVTRPAETVTLSEVSVLRMIDKPGEKLVVVQTDEIGEIILWEGDAYDAIGQWTDLDVQTRLIEILSA
jgi:hypothetical protein